MSNYIKKGDLVYNFKEFKLYKLLKHETTKGYKYFGYKLYYIDNDIVKDITHHLQTRKKYGWRGDKKENATIVANAENLLQYEVLILKDVKVCLKNKGLL